MFKKTFTYTDYNNVVRTEEHYFHLTKSELVKMQMGTEGGYAELLQRAIDAKDVAVIISVLDELIDKSYGVKSLDGKRFEKSPELVRAFKETEAYDQMFMEMLSDADKAAEFVNGILPADMPKA